jgi:hypothetical protein
VGLKFLLPPSCVKNPLTYKKPSPNLSNHKREFLSIQSIEQVGVSGKSISQARENFDLATGRYPVGVGSPGEVPLWGKGIYESS